MFILQLYCTVEADVNGSSLTTKSCVRCASGTFPSSDRNKCLPCLVANCTCPITSHELLLDGTLCVVRTNMTLWPDERDTHIFEYDVIGADVESKYLKENLRGLLYKCVKVRYNNTFYSIAFTNNSNNTLEVYHLYKTSA